MLTLEVNGQFITWPADFALIMMRYYKKHGKPFLIHRKCIHSGNIHDDFVYELAGTAAV